MLRYVISPFQPGSEIRLTKQWGIVIFFFFFFFTSVIHPYHSLLHDTRFPSSIVYVNANIAYVYIHYDLWRNDLRAVSFVGGGGGLVVVVLFREWSIPRDE